VIRTIGLVIVRVLVKTKPAIEILDRFPTLHAQENSFVFSPVAHAPGSLKSLFCLLCALCALCGESFLCPLAYARGSFYLLTPGR
jgi:hypothetical protein